MSRGFRSIHISLPLQIVGMVVALVILSVSAIGIPSILVMRDQLDRQAWLLVEQGSQMTQALLSAQSSHLADLAILTAQRPSLLALVQQGDREALTAYLERLQGGSDLDVVLVCAAEGQPLAQAGLPISAQVCATEAGTQPAYAFHDPGSSNAPTWLIAAQPVQDLPAGLKVILGQVFDEEALEELHEQTGLEHILLVDRQYTASSFSGGEAAWQAVSQIQEISAQVGGWNQARGVYDLPQGPYYTLYAPIENTGLEMVVLLPVSNIKQIQSQSTWRFAGGILAVIFTSSLLGILLAKRISLPLESLRNAAVALRWGDLVKPVSIKTKVFEINQVAYALEDARINLLHSLTTLRKEKAWTDHLLGSVVEGIVAVDRLGRITFFSAGAETISGWKGEQVLGKNIDEVFLLPGGKGFLRDVLPAPGGKQTIVTVLGNNRRATLAMTSAKLVPPDAGKTGVALVLRDVSSEEAIHRLLGDFLANITHEFRTPLSALAASIELLLEQLPSLSQAELKELLVSLHLGTFGLQTLIDNLLEGASIEAGRFRVRPRETDLRGVVQDIVRTMQPLFEKYGQRLILQLPDELPLVWADPRRTGQVLVNLLSNAVKIGPSGSEIRLAVTGGEGEVQVRVEDQGSGLSPEQIPDIFNRFVHTQQNDHRAEHGAGLGLSVVKAIVEAQAGRVGVISPPNCGAIFWFTLPVVKPEAGEKHP